MPRDYPRARVCATDVKNRFETIDSYLTENAGCSSMENSAFFERATNTSHTFDRSNTWCDDYDNYAIKVTLMSQIFCVADNPLSLRSTLGGRVRQWSVNSRYI